MNWNSNPKKGKDPATKKNKILEVPCDFFLFSSWKRPNPKSPKKPKTPNFKKKK
jgi:hypothetical protein